MIHVMLIKKIQVFDNEAVPMPNDSIQLQRDYKPTTITTLFASRSKLCVLNYPRRPILLVLETTTLDFPPCFLLVDLNTLSMFFLQQIYSFSGQ